MHTIFMTVIRYILPLFAIIVLERIARSMFNGKREKEVWGYIQTDNKVLSITHWENLIGRSRSADIRLNDPQVSRLHAVLIRSAKGTWRIFDIFSKGGIRINGDDVETVGRVLEDGDVVSLADISVRFRVISEKQRSELEAGKPSLWRNVHPAVTLLFLTVFQALLLLENVYAAEAEYKSGITMGFVLLMAIEWFCYFAMRTVRRTGFEAELAAFFLSSIGLSVIASSVPGEMMRQIIIIGIGVGGFFLLGWWLRDLDRTKMLRVPAAVVAIGLLGAVAVLGTVQNGARNWIYIGGMSVQPSELVKIAYIYVGAATLDRLFSTKNLIVYIGFSAVCVIALAFMGDFGTAMIFFATFLIISFMRSGSVATVALAVTGAGLAGFLMIRIKDHVAARFSVWRHIWEYPFDAGYQQTRALSAGASGGLFGKGAGNGWLKNLFAANTDTVFGMVCEELGLIVAVCAVLVIVVLALFAIRNTPHGRSAYYSIAACAAAGMLLIQLSLNVFGSTDILPFTGVTFPFVSRGGTSVISCWALLAFIKAGDTRKGASFVVKAPDAGRKEETT